MVPCRYRRGLIGLVTFAALWLASLPASAQGDAVLYRVFLNDGSSVVSFGEFARVGDQLVFSLPLGEVMREPRLHLASLPSSTVDWEKTERYADTVRFTHYLETRAESDYALMTSEVARALNEIALTEDREQRQAIAERARATLVDFPRQNYGYRSNDVRQMVGVLDQVIAELGVSAGDSGFSLSFVAMTEPPPMVPLLAPPTLRESIEQSLSVARRTTSPAERLSLLRTAVGLIDEHGADLSLDFGTTVRARITADIEREVGIERSYEELSRALLARAENRAAVADVRGVETVLRDAHRRDEALGYQRPDVVRAVVTVIEARLEAARWLRLERDRWKVREAAYRQYGGAIRRPLAALGRVRVWLDEIKSLAGPNPGALVDLHRRVDGAMRSLVKVVPPMELQAVHRELESALRFAQHASELRRMAVLEADMRAAWDASSAAAAALLMYARTQDDFKRAIAPPELR